MIAARRIGHPAIVAEDQEPGAVGPDLDWRHAVQDGPHRVLADAEVEVAAARNRRPGSRRRRRKSAGSSSTGPGRPRRRSATGTFSATAFRTRPDELASRHPLAVGGEGRQARIPAVGELAVLHPVELVGQVGILGTCTAPRGRTRRGAAPCHAGRCPGGSGRRLRRAPGTWRPRASRNCAWSSRTSSSPRGSPWAALVSCLWVRPSRCGCRR